MLSFTLLSRYRPLWLAAYCLMLVACGATYPKVSYDYDLSADFASFKQFAWAEPATAKRSDDPLANNSLVEDRIKSVIELQLQLKGIGKATDGPPNFLVSYQLLSQKHKVYNPGFYPYSPYYSYGLGFGYNRWPWYYDAMGMNNTYWEEYETHALVVDFLNPATHKQLWRGILHDAIDLTSDPAAQKYQLDSKVQYLFQRFPPGLNAQRR